MGFFDLFRSDPWRKECRNAFESAAQEVIRSPFGNLAYRGMIIGPRLIEVKHWLQDKTMWEGKSEKVLEEEFRRAIKKYIE